MARKEQAYEYIKNEIISGRFYPGCPVRENELSDTLKMSRSPIREALRELESEGVLVSYPSRGTFVSSLTPYDVEEIYELRSLLELWALEKGFLRITDEELNHAEELFVISNKELNWDGIHLADEFLHGLIIEKSGSKRLFLFMNNLNIQIERIRRASSKDIKRQDMSLREHMAIINNIRSRDLEASKEALKKHLWSVAQSAIEVARAMDMAVTNRKVW